MSAIVSNVINDSIAEELELEKGDVLLKINGIIPKDYIEYKYLLNSEEIEIEIKRNNGEIEIIEIEKDYEDDLGIVFESAIFDKIKPCLNKCIFCFVDQQPKGLRDSLYIKDDDYRLSYLQGTYVTLTNLTEQDKKRIETQHLGPLYVSVHTTNPELRLKMLKNPKAANIIENLKWLEKIYIPIHTQIVLCPGLNDKEELDRTLNDLYEFKNIVTSIAIVPVGITKFRKEKIKTIDKEIALDTIQRIEKFNKKARKSLASASDEFFIKAELPIPDKKYYSDFSQIEDGVGAIRLVLDDFNKRKKKLPKEIKSKKSYTLLASQASFDCLKEIQTELNKIKNFNIDIVEIKSDFWGKHVSVAGLITGSDIIKQLKGKDIKNLVLPTVMIRPYTEEFLDGITVSDIERELDCKITIINDIYSTKEIVNLIK